MLHIWIEEEPKDRPRDSHWVSKKQLNHLGNMEEVGSLCLLVSSTALYTSNTGAPRAVPAAPAECSNPTNALGSLAQAVNQLQTGLALVSSDT